MEFLNWLRRLFARKQLAGPHRPELTSRMTRREFKIREAHILARLERIRIDANVRDQQAERRHQEAGEWHQEAGEWHQEAEERNQRKGQK